MASNGVIHLNDFAYIKDKAIKAVISPEQTNLSADELELKNEAQQIAHAEADFFEAFLSATQEEINQLASKNKQLNQEIEKTGFISTSMNTADILETVGSHVQADLENREPAIEAKTKLMEADSLWKRFRAEHNLTHREAKYPTDYYVHFAPIAAIVVAEAIMNAFFYINENGLLGGAFTAFFVAIANLGVCGILGFGFRYHNLVKPNWKKNLGWTTLPLFIFFMIWFNATLAAFRVLNQLQTSNPFLDAAWAAFEMMIFRRMPFADMTSFTLFVVGIFFSLIAFYKGYTFDDAYPGYRDTDENKKKYQVAYDQEIARVMPDKTIDKLVKQLEDISRQANSLHRVTTLHDDISNKKEAYQNKANKTNDQLITAIKYFREHHLAIRATGMSDPMYFNDYSNIPVTFRDISINSLFIKIEEVSQKNQQLDKRVNDLVTPTIKIINTKKPQIATDAKREFIKQVDKSAQERIHPTA